MSELVYILNGPNLNLLGQREPETYGRLTLADIEARCRTEAERLGLAIDFRQRNGEGELVEDIHDAIGNGAAAIIINAAAYTHTSVALHDALRLLGAPVIELHLSNPAARERIRQTNYIAPVATACICGFGATGYEMAVTAALQIAKPLAQSQ